MSYSDPSLAMQKGTLSLMKAGATGVQTGGRIYDGVPGSAVKPYVSFGPFQMLPEHGDCLDGGEAFLTLDGWAAGPDTVQVKKLGAAIAADLDRAELVVDGQRLIELSIEQIQYMRDPDGITAHAVVTVHAWTEPVEVDTTPPNTIAAMSGAFRFNGMNATLRTVAAVAPNVLVCNRGSFAFAGNSATLNYNIPGVLQANAGTFAFAGKDATLTLALASSTFTLQADTGSFPLVGEDMTIVLEFVMPMGAGSFALAGQSATLTSSAPSALSLQASAGSFAFAGQDATLTPPVVAGGYVGPGDLTPGAVVWYGLRAYSSAQLSGTTKAIRLTTNSFSFLTDIFILPTGLLDYAAVNTWIAAHGTPYVDVIYDQTGSGVNLVQGGIASCAILTISPPGLTAGRAALTFVGSTPTTYGAGATPPATTQPLTASVVCNRTAATPGVRSGVVAGANTRFGYENGTNQFFLFGGSALLDFGTSANNTWFAVQAVFDDPHSNSHVNYTSVAGGTVNSASQSIGTGTFGGALGLGTTGGGDALTGYVTEVGIWNSLVSAGMGANQIAAWTTSNDFSLQASAGAVAFDGQSATLTPPAGGGEETETGLWVTAVIAASGTVSATQRSRVDTLIKAYKAAGVWTLLDHEWLFAAENAKCAQVDIVGLASHTASGTGSMTFTANRGYKEDGFGGYRVCSFAPSGGVNFQQNTGSFGVYVLSNRTTGAPNAAIGSADTSIGSYSFARILNAGGIEHDVNSSNFNTPANATTMGNYIICRTNSTTIIPYKNNAALATGTTAPALARPTYNWYIFTHNSLGGPGPVTPDEMASAFIGGAFTGTQALAKNAALNAYMTSVGCAVY